MLRVLFTGYAQVHFVCFFPLFDRLRASGIEVFLSGGLRSGTAPYLRHDARALFEPFGVCAKNILSVEEIRDRDFDLLFAANTQIIMPRSVGAKVQIFHGVSFRNRAIREENSGCDFYFLIGPYMQRKFAEAHLLSADDPRAVKIGFMKTDCMLNGELNRDEVLRSFGFDATRPIVLYAPTGQRGNSLETFGEEVIKKLVSTGDYDLLIKLHDHPKDTSIDWKKRLAPLEGDHLRIVRDFDVVPQLFLADLLLTDASSVSSEYSLLNRPMVFLDVPKVIESAKSKEGSMLDLDTWGRRGGIIARDSEEAVSAVWESLRHPQRFSEIRCAMAADLFFNPGYATQEALDWVIDTFLCKPAVLPDASVTL